MEVGQLVKKPIRTLMNSVYTSSWDLVYLSTNLSVWMSGRSVEAAVDDSTTNSDDIKKSAKRFTYPNQLTSDEHRKK